ncbi:MAG: 50S ribosomal protein L18 [Dehalococcoidia bacterium]|nr:MAG: 50S ribosomal protein L18 [Dehalococcoidia bacterium]
MAVDKKAALRRRHNRVRKRVFGTPDRPRLCIFRSLNHIYAQVVDDTEGRTLVYASSLDADIKSNLENVTKTKQAAIVGTVVAERARNKGISQVVFDRGGRKYHGRIKALADAVREGGLRV